MQNTTPRRSDAIPVSRRRFLTSTGATTLALGLPLVARRTAAQSKRIVMRHPGGPFGVAFEEAFYKPFRQATGIEVVGVVAAAEPTAQIKGMVDNKTYTWDLAYLSQATADQLVHEGSGYLEKLEVESHPDVQEIPTEFRSAYWIGDDVYSAVIAYRGDVFRNKKAPTSWKDLFDAQAIPGRRAFWRHPFDTIEIALLADGVPKERLYPCDVNRAFKSLDRIKKAVAVWYTTGAQVTQILKTGEVDLCMSWTARVQAAIDDGAPAAMTYEQHLWQVGGFGVLKGTPNADLCREFIKFAANARRQAAFTPHLAYGPTNPNAYKHIDPKRAAVLPTYPQNFSKGIRVDYQWRGQNKDKLVERFEAWLLAG
jgi:putative spermidine/putrescine transport system substrate-binding protein